MRVLAFVLVVAWVLSPAGAHADVGDDRPQKITPRVPDQPAKQGTASPGTSYRERQTASTSWMSTVGWLALVVVLILAAARMFRPKGSSVPLSLSDDAVQVLGRKAVDFRHTIHLVRCGSRLLVLGSSQDALSTLSEITDPIEVEQLVGLCKPSESAAIADSFGRFVRRFRAEAPADDRVDAEADPAILRLRERLSSNAPSSDESSSRETVG